MNNPTKALCRPLAIVAIAAVAGIPTGVLLAEDDAEPQDAAPELREYVEVTAPDLPASNSVATKLPTALRWIPANVGTVGPALIEEQQAVVLSDALRNVSSLNIQAQNGVHDFFVVRGFDSLSGSLILTDGVGEPESTFLPMYNVAAVEVLKGPGGFLYGKDPLAGAINVVRKQPLPTDTLGFEARTGSFGAQELSFDWNESIAEGHAFRLNAFRNETENYRDLDESTHYGFNPSYTWQIDGDRSLNVNLEVVKAEFTPDAGVPIYNGDLAPIDPRTNYASPFDDSEQDLLRFQVDYETRLTERVRLRNKFYVRELDWQSAGTLINGAFDVPVMGGSLALVSRSLTTLDSEQRFVGNQTEAIFTLGDGNVRHNILAGVELQRQTDESALQFGLLPEVTVFDPMETAVAVPPLFPFFASDAEADIIAPYVVDQIEIGDRYQILLGGRYDDIRYQDGPSSTDRDDSEFSPMFGFVYSPRPSFSLYVNGGRSYAPPGSRVVGERDPERSTQTEIGIRNSFLDGRLQTTWAWYDLERENIAIPDATGVLQTNGDQSSRGFEFELAAATRRGVRTVFTYAFNDSEFDEFSETIVTGPGPMDFIVVDRTGNRPAFTPRHMANLWVSKQFTGGFGAGTGVRLIDEQYIAPDNTFALDQALVWDLRLWYEFNRFDVKVGAENLTDETYAVRGFGNVAAIPADGRSVYVGLGFRM